MGSAQLEKHLGYWLRLVSNQVSAAFARALQERGVSLAEWVVLAHLDAAPALSAVELAAAMGMTRGAISKVLDKLEAKEWIARAVSPADNRVQVLSLTRRGRRRLPELIGLADANDGHFFGALDASDQAQLRALLARLAQTHGLRSAPIE